MTDRPFPEPQGQTAPGDEVAGRAHAHPAGRDRRAVGHGDTLARLDRPPERVGGGRQRIEDRLVARLAPTATGEAAAAARNIAASAGPSSVCELPARKPASMQAVPYNGPGRATDGRHEPVADGLKDLARRRGVGQLGQELADRSEPDHEVVAVVAVAEDRVEPGQMARMPGDHPVAPFEAGPEIADTGAPPSVEVHGGIGGWRRHGQSLQDVSGRPSVGVVASVRQRFPARSRPGRHFSAPADATLLAS